MMILTQMQTLCAGSNKIFRIFLSYFIYLFLNYQKQLYIKVPLSSNLSLATRKPHEADDIDIRSHSSITSFSN